jgi:hypothetical protein
MVILLVATSVSQVQAIPPKFLCPAAEITGIAPPDTQLLIFSILVETGFSMLVRFWSQTPTSDLSTHQPPNADYYGKEPMRPVLWL